jgi:phosphoglycerate dehydrogenase-like enzyme
MVSRGLAVKRPTVAVVMDEQHIEPLFGAGGARLAEFAEIVPGRGYEGAGREHVDVLITGWGAPRVEREDLERMPRLRAILHAAGTVKPIVSDAVWDRGLVVASAAGANAQPVAEFTLAMILLAGKDVDGFRERYRHAPELARSADQGLGNAGAVVGIVGASRIGRRVIELLRPFDLRILVSDPTVGPDDPIAVDAELLSLRELARRADVVSIHAPLLPETEHLIDREVLAAMRDGATIVNTARGGLIDETALIAELSTGRLRAVLDVTEVEPLPLGHPLRSSPGVVLTPHVAGAQGNELRRLGDAVLADLKLVAAGSPPSQPIRQGDLARLA